MKDVDKEEIDKKNAEKFLSKFVNKINMDFPFIRLRLFPKSELGLLVLYNKKKNFVYRYGYRCYKPGEDRIIWINTETISFNDQEEFDIMKKYGVYRLGYTEKNFSNIPIDDFVHNEILTITKEIIKKRLLDESNNINISLEKFFVSFREWGTLLEYPNVNYDTESSILPLDTENLMKIIQQRLIHKYIPYRFEEIPSTTNSATLREALQNLNHNLKIITRTALPYCDDPDYPSRYVKPSPEYFTKEGLKEYLADFMEKFIQEYRNLVERNFPTLKNKFSLYQKYPYYAIMQITKRDDDEKATGLDYHIFKNKSEKNEIEIYNFDEDKIIVNFVKDSFEITTKKGLMKSEIWINMTLDSLFIPINSILGKCILTTFVYVQIERDLEEIFGSDYKNISIYIH